MTESLDWKPAPFPAPLNLCGRTVTLEPLDAEKHTEALWQALQGHDALWTWLADDPPSDKATLRESLATKQASGSALFFAIVPVKTALAAGYLSLMRIDTANGVVEVGNVLLSPALQRTTEATEAVYLIARHVFEDLGYRRLEWKCNAENEPSRRAALRFGFTFESIFRQHTVIKGRNRNTAWYSMLDVEWPARKRAFEQWLVISNFDKQGKQRIRLEETL